MKGSSSIDFGNRLVYALYPRTGLLSVYLHIKRSKGGDFAYVYQAPPLMTGTRRRGPQHLHFTGDRRFTYRLLLSF